MLIEAGLLSVALAAGGLADRYSTNHAKSTVSAWLGQAAHFDWHSFVAQRSWRIYTAIFGDHSTSFRFILRSILLYVGLCVGSWIFLYYAFPSTLASILSVWPFGTHVEQGWWILCLSAGGLLYVLANAQTLYFLEILKTAPGFFKFVLVAYADFLITASIALFGVPLLLTAYTLGITHTGSQVLSLNVDFTKLKVDLSEELNRAISETASESGLRGQVDGVPSTLTVRVSFQDATDDLAMTEADFQAASDAINRGYAREQFRLSKDGIITYSSPGTFLGIVQRGRAYEGRATAYGVDGKSYEDAKAKFCREFSRESSSNKTYTIAFKSPSIQEELLKACLAELTAKITIPSRINADHISAGKLYKTYLLITLSDLTFSLTSGFKSYLSISPYALVENEDPAQVWNVYASMFSDKAAATAFDQIVLDAYLRQSGAQSLVVHRGLPAGSINFAIMSTALFNLIVMSVFFLMYPILKLMSQKESLSRFVDIDRHPFAILCAVLGVWAVVLLGAGRLLAS